MRQKNFALSKGYKLVTINELVTCFIDHVTGGKRWSNKDDQAPDEADQRMRRAW